jgi:hypothetical protein
MITLKISSEAMGTIEGSALANDAAAYDGGSEAAVEAARALGARERKKFGRGHTYLVETTPEGADTIAEYCEVVGETFAGDGDAANRRDGRALLTAARRIREQVARQAATA